MYVVCPEDPAEKTVHERLTRQGDAYADRPPRPPDGARDRTWRRVSRALPFMRGIFKSRKIKSGNRFEFFKTSIASIPLDAVTTINDGSTSRAASPNNCLSSSSSSTNKITLDEFIFKKLNY
jgi:hypothetical protein